MTRSRSGYFPISTLNLSNEDVPVLLLCPHPEDAKDFVLIQATPFQGHLYPDHLGFNIDHEDRITNAVLWRPIPPGTKAAYAEAKNS